MASTIRVFFQASYPRTIAFPIRHLPRASDLVAERPSVLLVY